MSLLRFKARNHPQQVEVPHPTLWIMDTGVRRDEIDDRGTDPELFARLDARFGFTLDVAAAAHNAKCARYFDRATDGLRQSWFRERVGCNPPCSGIRPWIEKAWAESLMDVGLIVMLVPANRTEQPWWQDHIEPSRDRGGRLSVEFLRGRPRFVMPGNEAIGANERPPFGCCLLIWNEAR